MRLTMIGRSVTRAGSTPALQRPSCSGASPARPRPPDDRDRDVPGGRAGGRGVVEDEPRRVPIPNGIDRLARLALEPKAGQLDLARARAVVAEHQRQLVGPGELAEV